MAGEERGRRPKIGNVQVRIELLERGNLALSHLGELGWIFGGRCGVMSSEGKRVP